VKKKNNQAEKRIRVMLVDDHAGMREALRTIINWEPDLTVVAEADRGRTALELIEHSESDVVLMDASMPEMNGIEATRRLKQLHPTVKIICLTLYEETTYLEEMVAAGASAYVLKSSGPTNVAKAIRAVAAGGTYFDKVIPRAPSTAAQDHAVIGELSPDELAVVKLLANGQTNAEISAELELTIPLVEMRRTAAMKKLGVRSRAELVRAAVPRKWLDT
jgi:DNA-binding NarL/FixJ family response regulator